MRQTLATCSGFTLDHLEANVRYVKRMISAYYVTWEPILQVERESN